MPQQKPGRSKQTVETPADFLLAVTRRFGRLDLDLAATEQNKKAPRCFTTEQDSLRQDWGRCRGNLWLNPPYGNIGQWAKKCADDGGTEARRILFLVPASVGANWYFDHVHGQALVLALSPRLKFVGHSNPYPKDLILAVYGLPAGFECWRWKP